MIVMNFKVEFSHASEWHNRCYHEIPAEMLAGSVTSDGWNHGTKQRQHVGISPIDMASENVA
jgi:hypothetical protein